MQFNPIAPRIASIPRIEWFTTNTAGILSDVINHLDDLAETVESVGSRGYRKISKVMDTVLWVADAIGNGNTDQDIVPWLTDILTTFDRTLPDLKADYLRSKAGEHPHRFDDEIGKFSEA